MNEPLRLLDLFSGIGGFSLGLERSGACRTVAFCEIEPYCKRVLFKNWPHVPQYGDIRELTAKRLADDGIGVDALCGGFPCQDLSVAGKGAGLAGPHSGLWREQARLVGELQPRYVIVENVSALLSGWLGDVLGDLAALGYDAEWHCIPASALSAPHRRDRIWIVAHPVSERGRGRDPFWKHAAHVGESSRHSLIGNWNSEPNVGRVAHGVPARVDRLRGLGNAVVPQIPELIGRAIAQAEGMTA